MKLIKKQETEVLQVYDIWMNSYINGDVETYDFYLDENCRFIGSTNNEEFLNRKDTTEFFRKTAEQIAGKIELRNNSKTIEKFGNHVIITHLFDAWFLNEKEWSYYARFRFSCTLHETKNGWRFIYQHFSTPDSKAEAGETIGVEQVSAENLQLRETIKRRTVELEQKNRELEIEAALEKVRGRTMAMQKSEELAEASSLLFELMEALGIDTYSSGFTIWDEKNNELISWMCNADGSLNPPFRMPLTKNTWHNSQYKIWQKGEGFAIKDLKGDTLKSHFKYLRSFPLLDAAFKKSIAAGHPMPDRQVHHVANFSRGNLLFITLAPVPSAHHIFKRFAKVFEQTYTRFLDLQKAESQIKESEIQLALERVRARTMAMQKSDELRDCVRVIYEQLQHLNFKANACNIIIIDKESNSMHYWVSGFTQEIYPESYYVPYLNHPYLKDQFNFWKASKEYVVLEYSGQTKKDFDELFFTQTDFRKVPEPAKEAMRSLDLVKLSTAYFNYGALQILGPEALIEEHANTLKRFAKVFEQTYTRFLDLQKAEAQVRESQIQLALERVRARTMAMQHSDELKEASQMLDEQVRALGIETWGCAFHIYNEDDSASPVQDMEWFSSANGILTPYQTPREKFFKDYYDLSKTGVALHISKIGEDEIRGHYEYLQSLPVIGKDLKDAFDSGVPLPKSQVDHIAFFKQGHLLFITYKEVPEAHVIFKRFAKVFEQTYTRFLDLQKAEAQTREAEINLGVERVRAKALAMHKSEEFMEVVATLKNEVMALKIPDVISATIFLKQGDHKVRMWDLSTLEKDKNGYQIPYDITFKLKKSDPDLYVKRVWENPENYFLEVQEEKDFKRLTQWLVENNKKEVAEEIREFIETTQLKRLYHTVKKLNNGKLAIDTLNPTSDEMEIILTKMGAAFDLAYKRFEDLQKAEAQTRAAKIESALEIVRSHSLAMQKPDELQEVVAVVAEKLNELGVVIDAGGVVICTYFPDSKDVMHWIASPDYSHSGKYIVPYFDHQIFRDTWGSKNQGDLWFTKSYSIEEKNSFFYHCFEHSDYKCFPEELKELILRRDHHTLSIAWSKNSAILIPSHTKGLIPSAKEKEILIRFATVFEQAYIRFMDLQLKEEQTIALLEEKQRLENTLKNLQKTQKQLIQSEKMASLGELTAGIAHEIQNPLNFVNNFSEVSNELLDEMMVEVVKGNYEEVKEILNDVKQNLEKINHHGKRADGIVKGMLQHSRKSTAEKEPTDINKLADEYLRLAYHGLRAKDKSFNATLETNFDESIGKINVIPQDMGRVILNLITNAFYATNEKKNTSKNSAFRPMVSVSTKQENNQLLISVNDNGNGIPKHVVDKIFQPFFTTKPTGEGTGLGLSMSYDIVKAHGGELTVETAATQGTTFTIKIPKS